MNCFFLVEGAETEVQLYPKLLSYFTPGYKRINDISKFSINNYYIFSGYGYPNVLGNRFKGALALIRDVNSNAKHTGIRIDALVLVLDVDKLKTVDRVYQSIQNCKKKYITEISEAKVTIYIVIQNRCVESWLLGNVNAFPQKYDNDFKTTYVDYFNVSISDPEDMISNDKRSDSQFARDYLSAMLSQQGLYYSKNNIDILTENYIKGILTRYNNGHLQSFKTFLDLVKKLKNRLS